MSPAQVLKLPNNAARSRRLRDLGLSWERLGDIALGHGIAVWLRIGPCAQGLRILGRTADGAPGGPGARALRIGETGQVPEIEIENHGPDPLLFPAHLVLSGGWQTRAVERSVIVPAGGTARVPVKCVEAGRWAPRDERTAGTFEVAERTGVRTRWSATRSMADQLHARGRFAAEQGTIWQHVDEELSRSPVASRTRSYEAFLRGVKAPFVASVRSAGVRPPEGANAVAIAPRGGGFWVEAFPTEGALAREVDDLLADLFDPASQGDASRGPTPVNDVDAWLDDLFAAPLRPLDRVAGTLGDAWAFEAGGAGAAGAAVGAAVLLDGALAHLGAGAPPPAPNATVIGSYERLAGAEGSQGAPRDMSAAASGDRPIAADSGGLERPRVDLDTMRAVFGRSRDLMPDEPPARERVQGYRLVRVLDRNISWIDVRIGGEGYAVLGSHDRCDLVLSGDSGIWLRHMAAICVRLDDDSVGLRIIDLKTDLPFFLEDETPRWSVVASGPFAMRLGRHVVCGFPIGPATGSGGAPAHPSGDAPVRAPAREGGDPHATGIIETSLIRGGSSPEPGNNVVPVRAPNEITAFLPQTGATPGDVGLPGPSAEHVRVTLERGGMGASVELPVEALDAGILLGRALNCFDGGLRRIFCEAISRAHVLLLRDQADVFAYDLCSTNGTRVAGQRIRRHRMNDAGTTLELGKKVIFRWKR